MTAAEFRIPQSVIDKLSEGKKVEAIKMLRALRGIDLTEAKREVDDWLANNPPQSDKPRREAFRLPAAVTEALSKGDKPRAIALLQEQSGIGRAEATAAIDARQQGAAGEEPAVASERLPLQWVLFALAAAAVLVAAVVLR